MENRHSHNTISDVKLKVLMFLMVLLGAFNPILIKIQGRVKVSPTETFKHPYFQVANMFLGEAMCFLMYHLKRYYFNRRVDVAEIEEE